MSRPRWMDFEPSIAEIQQCDDNNDDDNGVLPSTVTSPTVDTVAVAQLLAQLSSETEAHRQTKSLIDSLRREERDAARELSSQSQLIVSLQAALESKSKQIIDNDVQRTNLTQALHTANTRIEDLDKKRHAAVRDAESDLRDELDTLLARLEKVNKQLIVAQDGEKLWKSRAITAENNVERLQRQLAARSAAQNESDRDSHPPPTIEILDEGEHAFSTSTNPTTSTHNTRRNANTCPECQLTSTELAELRTETTHLRAKCDVFDDRYRKLNEAHVQLSNAHASLQRTSTNRIADLQDALQDAKDDMLALKEERDVVMLEREEMSKELQIMTARNADLDDMLNEADEKLGTLARSNDAADERASELQEALVALENHFRIVNSDLLSSQSALKIAEGRLRHVDMLLQQNNVEDHVPELMQRSLSRQSRRSSMAGSLASSHGDEDVSFATVRRSRPLGRRTSRNSAPPAFLDDLKETTNDTSLVIADLGDTRDQLALTQSELRQSQRRISAADNERDTLHLQLSKLQSEISERDEEISVLRMDIAGLNRLLQLRDGVISDERDQAAAARRQNDELEEQLLSLQLKVDGIVNHDEVQLVLHEDFAPPTLRLQTASALPDSSGDEHAVILVTRLRKERDEAQNALRWQVLERNASNEATKVAMAQEKAQLSAQVDQMTQLHASLEAQCQTLHGRVTELEGECEELHRSSRSAEAATQDKQAELLSTQQEATRLRACIDAQSTQMDDLRLELRSVLSSNSELEEKLTQQKQLHDGAASLVLSLQSSLDDQEVDLGRLQALLAASRTQMAGQAEEQDVLRTDLATRGKLLAECQEAKLALEQELAAAHAKSQELERNITQSDIDYTEELRRLHQEHAAHEAELQAKYTALEEALNEAALLYRAATNRSVAMEVTAANLAAQHEESQSEATARDQQMQQYICLLVLAAAELQRLRSIIRSMLQNSTRRDEHTKQLKQAVMEAQHEARVSDERASTVAAEFGAVRSSLQQSEAQQLERTRQLDEQAAVHAALEAEYNATKAQLQKATEVAQAKSVDVDKSEHEVLRSRLLASEAQVIQLRQQLSEQEAEGLELVADFNRLSNEMEKLEQQDLTRSEQSEHQARHLAEVAAQHSDMLRTHDEVMATMRSLEAEVGELQAQVAAKSAEAENADDRYLDSLKRIKRQEANADKLKVRIEALQRANHLLVASRSGLNDALSPSKSSAKKRPLPSEFDAKLSTEPDVVVRPSAKMELKYEPQLVESAPPVIAAPRAPGPIPSATGDMHSKATKTPLGSTLSRKPLIAVTANGLQPALLNSTKPDAKLSLATSKSAGQPFKPTSRMSSSISSKVPLKPYPGAADKVQRPVQRDSQSLLAALHALQRPATAT